MALKDKRVDPAGLSCGPDEEPERVGIRDSLVPEKDFPEVLRTVMAAFEKIGAQAFLLGPRARDLALGQDISVHHSFDLTVDTTMSRIEKVFFDLFGTNVQEERAENSRILTFRIPREERGGDGSDHWTFNVGPFRSYLPPLRCLRGQKLSGIILDLATREITIQAFAYSPEGDLIDPFGGTDDLRDRLIRPVFPTDAVFREAPSWLLKIARYVARYGFDAAPEVSFAAERDSANVLDVPRETWRREMEKVLCGNDPARGLQFMADTGLLGLMLPEVASLIGFGEDEAGKHKDIWAHTKQVVANAEATPVVRWAALCHDIGKRWTRRSYGPDRIHFFRHEDMSAMLFEGIAARFEMPPEDAARIHYIIKNHSRINLYREDWSDSAIRRLIRDVGEHLDDLIAFSKADLTSKRADKVEKIRGLLEQLQIRIMEVREADEQKNPLPKGIGNLIMERFGLQPGPEVGRLRSMLLQAVEEGRLPAGAEPEVYLSYLERAREASEAGDVS